MTQSSYPTVIMWFRTNRPAYILEWKCSECGYAGVKEIEDTSDLSPLPIARPVDLALYCDSCSNLDKTRIQVNVVHLSPTTVRETE